MVWMEPLVLWGRGWRFTSFDHLSTHTSMWIHKVSFEAEKLFQRDQFIELRHALNAVTGLGGH